MHASDDTEPTSVRGWTRFAALTLLVAAFSSCLVVGSYSKLSHTFDEPTHLVAGLEWLQLHRYTAQTENPPLSRIPLAVIPYLSGMRITNEVGPLQTGVNLLYGSGDYLGNVTRARLANLLFFWLTLLLTWTLSGGRAQPTVAALATCLVATLPSVVAHSGLATTDMPFVVGFLLAINPAVAECFIQCLRIGDAGDAAGFLRKLHPDAAMLRVMGLQPTTKRSGIGEGDDGLFDTHIVSRSACRAWNHVMDSARGYSLISASTRFARRIRDSCQPM